MAQLPTFISTAQAPMTTGQTSPRYVEKVDSFGKALEKLGKTGISITEEMFKTRNAQTVNNAKLGSTLELNKLVSDLSKMDPLEAMSVAEGRIQEIYDRQTEGMNAASREVFDSAFISLNGQTQANIQTQAVKNHNDQIKASLIINLDAFRKLVDPVNQPLSIGNSLSAGEEAVRIAVDGGHITKVEGVKLLLKFNKDVAEEGVTRWVQSRPAEKLMETFNQMDKGKFENEHIQKLWDQLDPDKKQELQKDVTSIFADLEKKIDEQLRFENNALSRKAKEDMLFVLKHYKQNDQDPENKRKVNEALERLSTNSQVPISTYQQIMEGITGRSDQFNKIEVENDIAIRIIRSDPTLTIEGILAAEDINFGTKQKLIDLFKAGEEEEMQQAKSIIMSSPLFVPKDKADNYIHKDKMNALQAKVFNEIYMRYVTTPKDQNFDAVGETRKALAELEKNGDVKEITNERVNSARQRLKRRGITDERSAGVYIAKNAPTYQERMEIISDLNMLINFDKKLGQ